MLFILLINKFRKESFENNINSSIVIFSVNYNKIFNLISYLIVVNNYKKKLSLIFIIIIPIESTKSY
jgi:hypothetical protein